VIGQDLDPGGHSLNALSLPFGLPLSFGLAEPKLTLKDYSRSPAAIAPLRTRIGISAGDVLWDTVAGRPDCFGLPVIEAARLVAVARPTEIICSPAVCLFARNLGRHGYEPLVPFTLKGFGRPTNAFRFRECSSPLSSG